MRLLWFGLKHLLIKIAFGYILLILLRTKLRTNYLDYH